MSGTIHNGTKLVCFAVPAEAGPFRAALRRRRCGPAPVEVLVTGMGKSNARRAIGQALDRIHPALVLTSGFAGGLDPRLARGQVVFDSPNAEFAASLARHPALRRAVFHCAATVATTPEQKHALRTATGADAVEMESGVITEVCRARGIPCATVRVISDAAGEALPLDFNALMTADQQLSPLKLTGALLRSPRLIGELIRFNARLKPCADALADALEEIIRHH